MIIGWKHKFKIDDDNSAVIATDKRGGTIKAQSVEALLLYEILRELREPKTR